MGNRTGQCESNKCKRSCTAYMAHLTKQSNAVSDLMLNYSNEFQIKHSLSYLKTDFKEIYKSNQEYCKLVDSEEIDNAINVFKNEEFRVAEITKTVENIFEKSTELDSLWETYFVNPFARDIPSKPANSESQRSSKSKCSNSKSSISSKSRKSDNSSKSHSSSKSSKSSNSSCRGGSRAAATSKMEQFVIIVITNCSILDAATALDPPLSWSSEKLSPIKHKGRVLASQPEEKFGIQLRLIEMKKEVEIETENEKGAEWSYWRQKKLKPAKLYLQLGQNTKNYLEKIELYTKNKPVASN